MSLENRGSERGEFAEAEIGEQRVRSGECMLCDDFLLISLLVEVFFLMQEEV